jgi:hypothetical protein
MGTWRRGLDKTPQRHWHGRSLETRVMPTIEEAEAALEAWKSATGQCDELVRAAHHGGVSKYRVTQITGITQPTVYRILKAQPAVQENLSAYLAAFTAQWPKVEPGGMTRLPGMAKSRFPILDGLVD